MGKQKLHMLDLRKGPGQGQEDKQVIQTSEHG